VYLTVDSSLSLKLQSKIRLPNILKVLWSCPVCVGFWVALALTGFKPVETLVVGFVGSVLYETKERFAPCKQCKNTVTTSGWKAS
jgi:hypothetical protein